MKELIPQNEHGLFITDAYQVLLNGRFLSDILGTDIFNGALSEVFSLFSADFLWRNILNEGHARYLTQDGFAALIQEIPNASRLRESYIQHFDELENQVLALQAKRELIDMLAEAVKDTHGDYFLEMELLCELITGKDYGELRSIKNIPRPDMLRSYLTLHENRLMQYLQRIDVGLVYGLPEYEDRYRVLEQLATKWREKNK